MPAKTTQSRIWAADLVRFLFSKLEARHRKALAYQSQFPVLWPTIPDPNQTAKTDNRPDFLEQGSAWRSSLELPWPLGLA